MTWHISKEFHLSASHVLEGLPQDHPCSRLHGHNWVVTLVLAGDVDEVGFVADFRDLDPVKRWLDDTLDHRHLNDVMDVNPTSEHLARWVFHRWRDAYPALVAVRVSETPKTVAEYRG